MKKTIVIFLFIISPLIINVSKSEAAYLVTAVNAARTIFNAGSAYVPAAVRGTSGAAAALRTGALMMPPGVGGAIAAAVVFTAVGYGIDRLKKYLDDKDLPIDPVTKTPRKRITKLDPPPGFVNPMPMDEMIIVGYYGTYNEAYNAIVAYHAAGVTWPSVGHQYPSGGGSIDYVFCYDNYSHVWVAFYDEPSNSHETFSPATPQDVADAVSDGLGSGDKAAEDGLIDVLDRIDDALENLNDVLRTKPQWQEIVDALNNSITQPLKDEVDDAVSNPDDVEEYFDDVVDTDDDAGVSQEGIIDAIKNAINDITGVIEPNDPAFDNPTKDNLTTILTGFMNSINGLPIISTLRGMSISAAGSSSLCVNLPARYGGTRCYDCGDLSGTLNAIGTALLSITTILSFIYIFKG